MSDALTPYSRAVFITKSDTVNFDFTTETQRAANPAGTKACDAILVGTHGAILIVMPDGTVVTTATTNDGTILPLKAVRVQSATTAATNMYALYYN